MTGFYHMCDLIIQTSKVPADPVGKSTGHFEMGFRNDWRYIGIFKIGGKKLFPPFFGLDHIFIYFEF